ncbi:MAG: gliding motility-associated C-terminal domain-containing protein [Bacteroidetes bacterium]|nr:gliding motility-associated C-terminal domain-containing protein [Bacteroidota bacterium]
MLYPFYYPGTYQILLSVEDHSGCWDSTEKTIEINEFPDCEGEDPYIYIPNAFTPNGDGINDFFEIKTLDLNISTLSIYNRFGEQIYTGTSWNGSFNKTICPEGIYGYTIQQQKGNKIIKETGTVLLLR